jgi:drug/metabolite transporter (DMT)-like permease
LPIPILYGLTVLFWGTSWFAMLFQVGVVPVPQVIAYRFGLAAALTLLFCWATRRRLRYGWRDHLFFAIQGGTLFWLNYYLFYLAVGDLASGLLAVCFSTILLMNIANGALFFGHRPDARVLAAGLVGSAGLALVFWPEILAGGLSHAKLVGFLLSIAATYSASIGNMVSVRHKLAKVPVIEANALGMAYGAGIGFLAALIDGEPFAFDPSAPYVISLLYLAIFASIIAFASYLTLVQRIGADRAAYATVVFPLLALLLSTLFEGYHWSWSAAAGVALVLGGNLLVLPRRAGRKPKPA